VEHAVKKERLNGSMTERISPPRRPRKRSAAARSSLATPLLALSLFVNAFAPAEGRPQNSPAPAQKAAAPAQRGPSDTVRAFHQALRERRFREAFALSVLNYAVRELSAEEFDDFKTDFERIAAGVPAADQLTGEQVSGGEATVFMNFGDETKPDIKPVELVRQDGAWIVGSRQDLDTVKKGGKKFLFEARIETHHAEVKALLERIHAAQFIYSSQHGGTYGDMSQLISAGLVPQDLLGTETTGYRFRVTLGKDAKSWAAFAEPARHNRTGRLSFYRDPSGLQSKDTGGKPLKPPSTAKP
jgi:hypothetical protein